MSACPETWVPRLCLEFGRRGVAELGAYPAVAEMMRRTYSTVQEDAS